jgi:hypothetical protein
MKIRISFILLFVATFSGAVFGQTMASKQPSRVKVSATETQFYPLSELKEGMKGKAYTVFRGTAAEEFTVEILGIVPGAIGPKQDMIVGRLSGANAERTQVFAGMSGSPVYIDGKLVGAIAYSFPFSKEPICGITPIDQMIGIFEQNSPISTEKREPKPFSFSELATIEPNTQLLQNTSFFNKQITATSSALGSVYGQTFQPIATPISFSGFSPQTLRFFEQQLLSVGLLPVASIGGSSPISNMKPADDKTLLGGDSVTMQLTRGDYSLAAAGTVTFRDGEKIYAFGHPFLSLGTSDLPMSESSVVIVIPNLNNSFKLAVPGAMVGSMTQDRATGVFGKLGQAPKMIPVTINLVTSRNQKKTLNFEVARDDSLTPLLVNIGVYNSLVSNERGMGDTTVEVEGSINIKDEKPVNISTRFSGPQATQFAGLSVALPVNSILTSNFDNAVISSINLNLKAFDGSKTASLERISLNKTEIRAGETLEIQAFVRTGSGRMFSQKIPVQIPQNTPTGKLSVAIGDGNAIQQADLSRQFVPKDLTELLTTINSAKKGDRLYVQINRLTNGAIIGASELPNLPPSVLATMNNGRSAGGFTPTIQTALLEKELEAAEFLISGQQTLQIEVIK